MLAYPSCTPKAHHHLCPVMPSGGNVYTFRSGQIFPRAHHEYLLQGWISPKHGYDTFSTRIPPLRAVLAEQPTPSGEVKRRGHAAPLRGRRNQEFRKVANSVAAAPAQ